MKPVIIVNLKWDDEAHTILSGLQTSGKGVISSAELRWKRSEDNVGWLYTAQHLVSWHPEYEEVWPILDEWVANSIKPVESFY